jgi:hypothetical protein
MLASGCPLPTLPARLLNPEEEELERKQSQLTALEAELAERELERATLQADLADLDKRYLDVVGRRYAELDGLEARIAEALARQNPTDLAAKEHAKAARSQAEESAKSVDESEKRSPRHKASHSDSLRTLYRQTAKLLHPDLTLDPDQKEIRKRLMAEVNDAYADGDEERIKQILRDWQASPENVEGKGAGADLVRIIRKIAQVEARLRAISEELEQIRESELFQLNSKIAEAEAGGRDLLGEMAARLDEQILEAYRRLHQIDSRESR